MKPLVLFCPQMARVAEKLRACCSDGVELGHIWWEHFESKFPDPCLGDAIEDRDVVFLASFDSPETVLEQLAVIYALPLYYGARTLKVWLPFIPGTKERIVEPGDIVTMKTIARMLSSTPRPKYGATEFHVYDLHVEGTVHYFSDNVRVVPHTALPLFAHELRELPNFENIAIAFPDTGAEKRFEHLLKEYLPEKLDSLVVYYKCRMGAERHLRLVRGDPKGKDVWIIDDLATTGGTLVACREKLVQQGATSASVFVTHGVFPKRRWERLVGNGDFANVWITDSCPVTAAQAVESVEPFRVLSLVPELADIILTARYRQ